MVSLVQSIKYGNMNKIDATTMGYYVIKFVSDAYNLQEDITCDRNIGKYGEIIVNSQYLSCMQEETKCHWGGKQQQQFFIVPTRTIVHPCLNFMVVKCVHDFPINACNRI